MPDEILFGKAFAVSVGVSAFLVLLLTIPRKDIPAWRLQIAWIVSMAIGFGCGFAIIQSKLGGPLHWPPRDALERLLTLILPALVLIEGLAVIPKVPVWLGWVFRVLLAVSVAPILLYGSVYLTGTWSRNQLIGILGGIGLALAASWFLLAQLWQRNNPRSVSMTLAIICMATGVAVMFSRSLAGGWPAIPLGGALAGAAILLPLSTQSARAIAPIGLGLVSLFSLVIMGYCFAELSLPHALILLAAPLVAWVPELLAPKTQKLLKAFLSVFLIVLVGGGVAFHARQESEKDSYSNSADSDYGDLYKKLEMGK